MACRGGVFGVGNAVVNDSRSGPQRPQGIPVVEGYCSGDPQQVARRCEGHAYERRACDGVTVGVEQSGDLCLQSAKVGGPAQPEKRLYIASQQFRVAVELEGASSPDMKRLIEVCAFDAGHRLRDTVAQQDAFHYWRKILRSSSRSSSPSGAPPAFMPFDLASYSRSSPRMRNTRRLSHRAEVCFSSPRA